MGTPNTDLKQYATENQEAACAPAEPKAEAHWQARTRFCHRISLSILSCSELSVKN